MDALRGRAWWLLVVFSGLIVVSGIGPPPVVSGPIIGAITAAVLVLDRRRFLSSRSEAG